METEERPVDIVKRTWHTPELRKNSIRDNTKFGPGYQDDALQPGTSVPTTSF